MIASANLLTGGKSHPCSAGDVPGWSEPAFRRTSISIVQLLYWFSFIALLVFSWVRSRGILHPHFMFCGMLFVLASDFMIRGNDDPNLQGIMSDDLLRYQLATLATLIGLGLSTAIVRRPYEASRRILQPEMQVGVRTGLAILLAGAAVLVVHQLYRMSTVDWSVQALVEQMLSPRSSRIWDQPRSDGTRDPVYQLINGMLPLVATSFAFLIFSRIWAAAIVAVILLVICTGILALDGSRTQAIIALASLAIFGLMSLRTVIAKISLVAGVGVLIALLTSAMILFRGEGLEHSTANFALTYHQDDSIYRAWAACAFANFSNYRWDPLYFFYYIASSPVPRVLWDAKPLLDENFYGGYKLWFVTTTFMGEWVSMLGVTAGFITSFVFGNLLYRGFYFAQRLLTMPLGLPAYLLAALYVYMVMRSMPNLTIFSYAPAAALLLVFLARQRQRRVASLIQSNPAWAR